jgi:hypothetical protein
MDGLVNAAAAAEYFNNRQFMGNYAPRPPIEKWRADQRESFERELARPEDERVRQCADAEGFAARR